MSEDMGHVRLIVTIALAGLLASPALPAVPSRHPAPLTSARYKAALETVRSCDDFFRRAGTLPDSTPLLRGLFGGGLPAKEAGETDDAFMGRVVRSLFQRLGDPSRLVTAVRIEAAAGGYDAATRTLTVKLTQPLEATLDRWHQAARSMELRAGYGFSRGALPSEIALPMSAEEATRFRAGSGRLRILSLFQDFGTDEAASTGESGPTRTYHLVRLTPKCAMFTEGNAAIPGWRFDGWSAARNAE